MFPHKHRYNKPVMHYNAISDQIKKPCLLIQHNAYGRAQSWCIQT